MSSKDLTLMRGALALAEGTPLRQLTDSQLLPCCSLVACWALQVAGRAPDAATDIGAWSRAGPAGWWARANVWDAQNPWSALEAIEELLGGTLDGPGDPSSTWPRAPSGWSVWQDWRDDYSAGHTYLVHLGRGGIRVVQSSTSRGYRDQAVALPLHPHRLQQVLDLPVEI
jgi:hypothetical protein